MGEFAALGALLFIKVFRHNSGMPRSRFGGLSVHEQLIKQTIPENHTQQRFIQLPDIHCCPTIMIALKAQSTILTLVHISARKTS